MRFKTLLATALISLFAYPTYAQNDGLIAIVYIKNEKANVFPESGPNGIAIGEFVDKQAPVFGYGNLEQDETALSAANGSMTGIEWVGSVNAKSAGNYTFLLESEKTKETNDRINGCVFEFNIVENTLLEHKFKMNKPNEYIGRSTWKRTFAAELELPQGKHPISVWLQCGIGSTRWWGDWVRNRSATNWTLKVKTPSDRFAKVQDKGFFTWE